MPVEPLKHYPSLIRYPGSKAKLVKFISDRMPDGMRGALWAKPMEYREPFFGAGQMGLRLLANVIHPGSSVWINDIDSGISALWMSVLKKPNALCTLITEFEPSADKFYEFKETDGITSGNFLYDGFKKLALHRMSMSGFGAMSGGPLGGKAQAGLYLAGCRWRAGRLVKNAQHIHGILRRFKEVKITCVDFDAVIEGASENCFLYLDPPYFVKGKQLYKYNMAKADHNRLANSLKATRADWTLSYDDVQEIRQLYDWATISEIEVRYSNAITDGKRPKNKEIVIVPNRS